MALWVFIYDKPAKSSHVNEAELAYIHQDEEEERGVRSKEQGTESEDEPAIGFLKCFTYRQTWSFIFGWISRSGNPSRWKISSSGSCPR